MKQELKLRYLKELNRRLEKGSISKREYKKEIEWVRSLEGGQKTEKKSFIDWLKN